MTIVNLRGTSGAGKSTVVHTLLKNYPHEVVQYTGKRGTKPLVYRVGVGGLERSLFVFGAYHTQCGGCDGITDYAEVVPELLRMYAPQGEVLFEGLLISGGFGRVGEGMVVAAKAFAHEAIFALLDTPLALSLERIAARRAAKGKLEPLNPLNTEMKYKAAHASHAKLLREGHDARLISHKTPFRSTMALFGVKIAREPKHATAQDHY
jgi:hypothetical protein